MNIYTKYRLWRFIPFVVRRNIRPSNWPYAFRCVRIAPKGKIYMTFKWALRV